MVSFTFEKREFFFLWKSNNFNDLDFHISFSKINPSIHETANNLTQNKISQRLRRTPSILLQNLFCLSYNFIELLFEWAYFDFIFFFD